MTDEKKVKFDVRDKKYNITKNRERREQEGTVEKKRQPTTNRKNTNDEE